MALEVGKTTSRWYFGKNRKIKILPFCEIFDLWVDIFFKINFSSTWKTFFFSFCESMGLNLSLPLSQAKKSQKLTILGRNEYLSFWAILKKNFQNFEKMSKNWNFQRPLEPKIFVLWKNFTGHKMRKMFQKKHFLALEVGKTTSRWYFGKNRKIKILPFLTFSKNIFFKSSFASAWKLFFFFNFENTPTQL